MILNPDVDPSLFHDCQWLPIIDWNVKFFGAHIHRVQADWCMPEESHIGFEIALILEGRQETIMENNVYSVGEGDILIIPPGFKHVSQCVSPNGMYYFSSHFNVDDPLFRQEMIKSNQLFFRRVLKRMPSCKRLSIAGLAWCGKAENIRQQTVFACRLPYLSYSGYSRK